MKTMKQISEQFADAIEREKEKFTWQKLRKARGKQIFYNDLYIVRICHRDEDFVHLSIIPVDGSPRHDWREFQEIKNQLAGKEWEGLELFPAESRLIDHCNSYNLFCYRERRKIGIERGRSVKRKSQTEWPQRL